MTLYVLVGPSGVGKTTLQHIFQEYGATGVVSTTTRTPRSGEINGVDYHFVNDEEFDKMIENDEFLEYVSFGDNRYGVENDSVEQSLKSGINGIAVIVTEIYGYLEIKKKVNNVKGIFIDAHKDVILNRLFLREGGETETYLKRIKLIDEEKSSRKYFQSEIILDNLNLNDFYNFVEKTIKNEKTNHLDLNFK